VIQIKGKPKISGKKKVRGGLFVRNLDEKCEKEEGIVCAEIGGGITKVDEVYPQCKLCV